MAFQAAMGRNRTWYRAVCRRVWKGSNIPLAQRHGCHPRRWCGLQGRTPSQTPGEPLACVLRTLPHFIPTARAMPRGPCFSLRGHFYSLVSACTDPLGHHPAQTPVPSCVLRLALRTAMTQPCSVPCWPRLPLPPPLHPVLKPCLRGFLSQDVPSSF